MLATIATCMWRVRLGTCMSGSLHKHVLINGDIWHELTRFTRARTHAHYLRGLQILPHLTSDNQRVISFCNFIASFNRSAVHKYDNLLKYADGFVNYRSLFMEGNNDAMYYKKRPSCSYTCGLCSSSIREKVINLMTDDAMVSPLVTFSFQSTLMKLLLIVCKDSWTSCVTCTSVPSVHEVCTNQCSPHSFYKYRHEHM